MNLEQNLAGFNPFFGIAFLIWVLFWKTLALWRAAKYNQVNWFVAIVILNSLTFGVLEIIYLFKFAKTPLTIKDLKEKKFLPK
jgi:hypothetical protein